MPHRRMPTALSGLNGRWARAINAGSVTDKPNRGHGKLESKEYFPLFHTPTIATNRIHHLPIETESLADPNLFWDQSQVQGIT